MKKLFKFFDETVFKKSLSERWPYFYEQATRQFFYKDSTFDNRFNIIKSHFDFLISKIKEEKVNEFYFHGVQLYEGIYNKKKLSFNIIFSPGQRKEGLLSLILKLNEINLYQIIFWFSPDLDDESPALWIGAIQGSNKENALEVIRQLTKDFYGYRTKNLILFVIRILANSLGVKSIYAISDYGYYANNHVRIDRKLKISLNEFWTEVGGYPSQDKRFYQLSLIENRKSIEEIKSNKRNLYRNRFETLDTLKETVEANLKNYQK